MLTKIECAKVILLVLTRSYSQPFINVVFTRCLYVFSVKTYSNMLTQRKHTFSILYYYHRSRERCDIKKMHTQDTKFRLSCLDCCSLYVSAAWYVLSQLSGRHKRHNNHTNVWWVFHLNTGNLPKIQIKINYKLILKHFLIILPCCTIFYVYF